MFGKYRQREEGNTSAAYENLARFVSLSAYQPEMLTKKTEKLLRMQATAHEWDNPLSAFEAFTAARSPQLYPAGDTPLPPVPPRPSDAAQGGHFAW